MYILLTLQNMNRVTRKIISYINNYSISRSRLNLATTPTFKKKRREKLFVIVK